MEPKRDLKQKIAHEMQLYVGYTIFLAVLLWAFSVYRRLILGEYAINYIHDGYHLIEAMILAKVILIGQTLGLGRRFLDKPLIYPTIYKTLVFTLFTFLFSILEHCIAGSIEGKNLVIIYKDLIDKGIYQILAEMLVLFIVFFFMFAFLELERVLGEGTLYNLFFKGKSLDRESKNI